MSGKPVVNQEDKIPEIDFKKIQDIIYWSKKWEISPYQLIEASKTLQTNNVKVIESYLRERGFAI